MNIKTDGIILRETMTGEQDRLVTILTRSNGVIKAFVNGARNPKNKNVVTKLSFAVEEIYQYHNPFEKACL